LRSFISLAVIKLQMAFPIVIHSRDSCRKSFAGESSDRDLITDIFYRPTETNQLMETNEANKRRLLGENLQIYLTIQTLKKYNNIPRLVRVETLRFF
jgi:hypothetical protein